MFQPKVLFEDEHLLAIEKPAGMLTVASNPSKRDLLSFVRAAFTKENSRIRPINRLDRESSGIVLYAKTKECYEEAVEKKKLGHAEKTYLALVEDRMKFKNGKITSPLPARRDGKAKLPAVTSYHTIKEIHFGHGLRATLIQAKIRTGRFHQIRRHFAHIGHPLIVDFDYQDRETFRRYRSETGMRHFLLHCEKMNFPHFVTGKPLEITCPPPEDFKSRINPRPRS
ncbi:MAG: RluA family pseudouridine synthase [Candidatus Gracilibacteria bacterium]